MLFELKNGTACWNTAFGGYKWGGIEETSAKSIRSFSDRIAKWKFSIIYVLEIDVYIDFLENVLKNSAHVVIAFLYYL